MGVSLPPLPGAALEEGASCLLAHGSQVSICVQHMEFLGGLDQREQLSARPLFPGLPWSLLPSLRQPVTQNPEGTGGGPSSSGAEIRKGPQGSFCHIQPLHLQSEVTGPESQFQKPEVLTCRAVLLRSSCHLAQDSSTAGATPRGATKNWERQSERDRKRALLAQRKKVRKWAATGVALPLQSVVLWSGV